MQGKYLQRRHENVLHPRDAIYIKWSVCSSHKFIEIHIIITLLQTFANKNERISTVGKNQR